MSFFNADIRVTGNDGLILKDLGEHATTPGSGLGTLYYNGGQLYIRNSIGTNTSLSSAVSVSTSSADADRKILFHDGSNGLLEDSDTNFTYNASNGNIRAGVYSGSLGEVNVGTAGGDTINIGNSGSNVVNLGKGTTGKVYIRGQTSISNGPSSNVDTFTSSDITPSVSAGNLYETHTGTLTITGFDDGIAGQTITIFSRGDVTYDVTDTNLKGGSTDIVTSNGDVTVWNYDGSNWYLIQYTDQTADMGTIGGGGGGSTAADDITVGDSTVNISTTSGSIIMHSVNNASNSIIMTSNSGANETIEVHNIQGTNSASILLKSYYGGITLEGLSTNLNNDPGILAISRSTPTSNGSGFAPLYFNSFITEAFGDKVTTFQIDVQNLVVANNSVSNLSVVVGKNNSTNSFFGRYEESKMGTIYKMEMICIETPTPDIGPGTEVGFSQAGMYTGYILSNGTVYSPSGGYGGGLSISFDLTENGGIKEIFVIDAGSGYDPADSIAVLSDNTMDTYYFNYFPSDRRVTISTNDVFGSSSNNSNIGTSLNFGGIPSGSGLTVDLKSVVLAGTYYYYGVSVNNYGSGYSSLDILSSNDLNYTFDLIVTASSGNLFSLGSNSSILSTGETDILNLAISNTTVSKLSTIPLTVPTTLENNDYFYLIHKGLNPSNSTITAGKFLIKMYGSSF
jgi:hypothetical protein